MQEVELIRLYGAPVLARLERIMSALRGRQGGQSTVEYALIGALIVIMASTAVATLGGTINGVFVSLNGALRR
jgi:Flp pilus assembly pilin Flp